MESIQKGLYLNDIVVPVKKKKKIYMNYAYFSVETNELGSAAAIIKFT